MAKNKTAGDNQRKGAVKTRSQVKNPITGTWTKRDDKSGKFMDVKADPDGENSGGQYDLGQKPFVARCVWCAVAQRIDKQQEHEDRYAQEGGCYTSPTSFDRRPTSISAFAHWHWIAQCTVLAKKHFGDTA